MLSMDKKIKRNLKISTIFMATIGLTPHALIAVLYYEQLLGSYALAMSVFSVVLLSTSISEIPLGILSDFIGRSKTMIVGAASVSIGFVFLIMASYVSFNPIYFLYIGSIFQGFCLALFSGTDEALIYETAEHFKGKEFKKYYSRIRSVNQFFSALSAVIAGLVSYYFSYVYCFYISFFLYLSSLFLTFLFVDVPLDKNKNKIRPNNIYAHVIEAISLFIKNRKLRLISLGSMISSASAGALHRFEMGYFNTLMPEYLYGIPRLIKQILGTFSFGFASKIIDRFGSMKTLISSTFLGGVFMYLPLLLNNIFTPFLYSIANLFYGTKTTATSDLLQTEFSNEQRATMASLISLGSSIIQAVLVVIVGVLADKISARYAIFSFVILKIFVLGIYFVIVKDEKLKKNNL